MMHALASCTVSPFVLQRGARRSEIDELQGWGLGLGSSQFFSGAKERAMRVESEQGENVVFSVAVHRCTTLLLWRDLF
jgi:hypothetical protein